MTGTTAGNPPERDGDRLLTGPLSTSPPAADVEAELQRIARQRLAPPTEADAASSSRRGIRSRRPSIAGGFDSPDGFVFGSD